MITKEQANMQSDTVNKINFKLQQIYDAIQQACKYGLYKVEVQLDSDKVEPIVKRIAVILRGQGFEVNFRIDSIYTKLYISWGI